MIAINIRLTFILKMFHRIYKQILWYKNGILKQLFFVKYYNNFIIPIFHRLL